MAKNDMLSLLEQEHKEVSSLLKEILAHPRKPDLEKIQQVKSSLELHTKIEEKLLYPKAEKEKQASQLISDAYKEHQEVKDLLKELKDDAEPDELIKYCEQIQIGVEHHVKEEEGELFPLLRKLWDKETLQDLGEKMQEMKEKELARH